MSKNVLPTIIDPPRRCITFDIPDEPQHVAAFFGAILQLAYWFNWQRDDAHTAKPVSGVWQEVFNQASMNWLAHECGKGKDGGQGVSTEMAIRQNPTNPCIIESSQDGTEWCPFIDLSKCTNFGTQPGVGNKPPEPGGGTQQTCKALAANGTLLLPLLVNAGDQITLNSVNGAGWDGVESDFGPLWRFANGDQYIGGIDVGFPRTDSGDPLPTANHMKIIAGYGGGPGYLDLPVGTAITIPGGVSNAQIWIQVNDSTLANNQGSYDVCVTVKNNAAGGFSHTFDFTLASQAWTLTPLSWGTNGEYLAAQGWHGTCNGSADKYNQIVIQRTNPNPAIVFTDLAINYDETPGNMASTITSIAFAHHTDGSNETLISRPSDSTVSPSTWHGSTTDVDYFWLIWSCGINPGGSCPVTGDILIPQIVIGGNGTDPF